MSTSNIFEHPSSMDPVQLRMIVLLNLSPFTERNVVWLSLEQATAMDYAVSLIAEGVEDQLEAFIRQMSIANAIYEAGCTSKAAVEDVVRSIKKTMSERST